MEGISITTFPICNFEVIKILKYFTFFLKVRRLIILQKKNARVSHEQESKLSSKNNDIYYHYIC